MATLVCHLHHLPKQPGSDKEDKARGWMNYTEIVNESKNERMNEWTHGKMDGWMNERLRLCEGFHLNSQIHSRTSPTVMHPVNITIWGSNNFNRPTHQPRNKRPPVHVIYSTCGTGRSTTAWNITIHFGKFSSVINSKGRTYCSWWTYNEQQYCHSTFCRAFFFLLLLFFFFFFFFLLLLLS